MNSGSTPGTSYGLQANTSTFCTRNSNSSTLSTSLILAPIWILLLSSSSILTLIKPSAQLAPIPFWGSYSCYKGTSSAGSFCLISRLTTTTKHYLATCWFPLTTAIPCGLPSELQLLLGGLLVRATFCRHHG